MDGLGSSAVFRIATDVYNFAFYTATRAMYLWRCGTAVSGIHNGNRFLQEPCHLSDGYMDYAGGGRTIVDGTGGWHDAGDYNKYIVNAGITVGMMFHAWEHFGDRLGRVALDIPESGGPLPDFLAEIKWEMDWVLKMQAPDGSVYHKLTALNFCGFIPADQEDQERYFTPWGSAATADFVAITAMAARVFRPYDSVYADRCLTVAEKSYSFLADHPDDHKPDLGEFTTGGYNTTDPDDRLWAAAEMWETTGDESYLRDFESRLTTFETLVDVEWDWGNVKNLGIHTYLMSKRPKDAALEVVVRNSLLGVARGIVSARADHGYARPLGEFYKWGCNGSVARQTLTLFVANQLDPDREFTETALDAVAHLFGRNPYNRSYVTGLGHNPPMFPHDRRSGSDDIVDPWPGYLVGGPTPGALDWVDDEESFRTNEIAINWQAALIYALAWVVDADKPMKLG